MLHLLGAGASGGAENLQGDWRRGASVWSTHRPRSLQAKSGAGGAASDGRIGDQRLRQPWPARLCWPVYLHRFRRPPAPTRVCVAGPEGAHGGERCQKHLADDARDAGATPWARLRAAGLRERILRKHLREAQERAVGVVLDGGDALAETRNELGKRAAFEGLGRRDVESSRTSGAGPWALK